MENLLGITFGTWLLCAVMAYVFLLPLRIRAKQRHEANPTLQLIDPAEVPPPAHVQQRFEAFQRDMGPAGFEPQGTILMPRPTSNTRSLMRIYANPKTGEMGMVAVIYGMAFDRVVKQVEWQQFSTQFASGILIGTGNLATASIFPPRPNIVSTHVPWVSDPKELYCIHQAICVAKAPAMKPTLRLFAEFHGDVVAYLKALMRDELADAVRCGYYQLSADGTEYRPTLKGAYLMNWKVLPPFKGMYAAYRRQQTRRLLAEVGVE